MGFKSKSFDTPTYIEQSSEIKRIIIISCEGENTEPEYFETIKTKLSEYIYSGCTIHIVPHQKKGSEPEKIVCNLDDYIKEEYDYKRSDNDEMWVILDREKVDERKKDILEMIPQCREKNYHIALTNPLFEFWLLLHIVDISLYNRDVLYKNEWVSSSKNRRFIDKELSNKLENGYSKKKNKFNQSIVTKENILRALEQERLFENELEKIIDNLGSNVGELIRRILDF